MNEQTTFRREFAIVPTVARVISVLSFVIVQIGLGLVHHYVKDRPPDVALVAISIVGGLFLAGFILLVGYVNADSKRRGMNSLLWTLLVIFIPKAIGFIAYFLLRKPIVTTSTPCPKCGTPAGSDFRFCPKCGYSFTPICSQCGHGISNDFGWCPYCGKPVGTPAPAAPGPLAT